MSVTTVNVRDIARNLASHRTLWDQVVAFDPVARYFTRVAAGTDFEAWLLTWLPGQGTDWHDHGDSAGSFVVLRGLLSEQVATSTGPDSPPRVAAAITELGADEQRTFGRHHLHRIVNNDTEPAVSLHVYSPKLTFMTTYAAAASGTLRPVALHREGVHW